MAENPAGKSARIDLEDLITVAYGAVMRARQARRAAGDESPDPTVTVGIIMEPEGTERLASTIPRKGQE